MNNKVQYLKNKDINIEKWDACINHALNTRVYALSWYLDAVCQDWDAIVLEDYKAVLPLPIVRKYGLEMLITPFMVQQLGVFSKLQLNQTVFDWMIAEIPKKFKRVHLNFNSANDYNIKGFVKSAAPNYELLLNKNYETLSKKYNQNTRRNLKKHNIIDWQYVVNIQPENCVQLFKENKGKELKQDIDFYQNVIKVMYQTIHRGNGQLMGMFESNTLCACGFFVYFQNRIYNLFPASNDFGKKNGAMFGLIDKIIQENSESELILDFEGSKVEGVARFYRGFGAMERSYWTMERNELPFYLKLFVK